MQWRAKVDAETVGTGFYRSFALFSDLIWDSTAVGDAVMMIHDL